MATTEDCKEKTPLHADNFVTPPRQTTEPGVSNVGRQHGAIAVWESFKPRPTSKVVKTRKSVYFDVKISTMYPNFNGE